MRRKMIFLSFARFLFTGFLLVGDIGLATSQNPENTAVLVGTPVANLNCSSSSTSASLFVWYFLPFSGGQRQTIVVGCIPSFSQYNTVSPTPNSCNLQVLYATSDFAGLYTCSPGSGTSVSAEFIVLKTNATCSNTPDGSNQHKLTCGIGYAGNMQPKVTWFNGTNYEISSTPNSNASYVTASFNVSGSEVLPNICKTNFTQPSNLPANRASNAPDFTSTCNVTSYNKANFTSSKIGWPIAFGCVLAVLVVEVVVIILFATKVITCTIQQGCGRAGFITGSISATTFAVIGIILGSLLAVGVILVGASSECCYGWIGGFTIVIFLVVACGIIILCQAFDCLCQRVAPEDTNKSNPTERKGKSIGYVSPRTA